MKKFFVWLDGKKTVLLGALASAAWVVYQEGPPELKLPASIICAVLGAGTVAAGRAAIKKSGPQTTEESTNGR